MKYQREQSVCLLSGLISPGAALTLTQVNGLDPRGFHHVSDRPAAAAQWKICIETENRISKIACLSPMLVLDELFGLELSVSWSLRQDP